MNTFKRIVKIVCVVVVTLAVFFPAYAMDFDVEKIYESVFVIYSGNSLGSGFAIGENCIITNAHVINKNCVTRVATYGGEYFDTFVIVVDESRDIAILGVKGSDFTPLRVAELSNIKIGDDVYVIGAPNSLAYTLTKGVISAKDRKVGRYTYLQTDAAINTGNSGGPLLNESGEVVGVNSYKMSDSEGIGLAIPIDIVTELLDNSGIKLDDYGNVSGTVSEPDVHSEEKNDEPNSSSGAENAESNMKVFLLSIGLAVSLLLNIVLLIILICRKRKKVYITTDPSERTDFDIDILE